MTIKQLVEAIDAQVLTGDIIGAFDKFAAENCITSSGPHDITHSKTQKLEALRWFFNNVATINNIKLKGFTVSKNTTDSQFEFNFTANSGQPLVYNEVIRRTWKDGVLLEELYLIGQSLDAQPAASAAPTQITTAKTPTDKTPKPQADKKPATKSAATKVAPVAKTDDLTIVEGIGPKIAELLNNAGINSFAELASTKPAALKAILEAAGKRYQMHEPATWPKQATLARDGKKAELEKLQTELKGGVKQK